MEFGRILALPELMGPSVRGLSIAEHGFIPVTPYGEVRGVPDVYAAGDATDFPVKHGGIAAQQADTAATSIAALAGAHVERKPFHPTIRGLLLTGDRPTDPSRARWRCPPASIPRRSRRTRTTAWSR
jgi:sulfide:quinone oxidoreductase